MEIVEIGFVGWKSKLLSQAGRATLVKHVVTTIPNYNMSSNKISLLVFNHIEINFSCFPVEKERKCFERVC